MTGVALEHFRPICGADSLDSLPSVGSTACTVGDAIEQNVADGEVRAYSGQPSLTLSNLGGARSLDSLPSVDSTYESISDEFEDVGADGISTSLEGAADKETEAPTHQPQWEACASKRTASAGRPRIAPSSQSSGNCEVSVPREQGARRAQVPGSPRQRAPCLRSGQDASAPTGTAWEPAAAPRGALEVSRFGSTEAVVNEAAARPLGRETLHEAIAALWHEALLPRPARAGPRAAAAAAALPPCLPLPGGRPLRHGDGRFVNVAIHPSSSEHTEAIVVFLPGTFGGVGPCRAPGIAADEEALFPRLAAELSQGYAVDCHRVSWMMQNPDLEDATHAVCRVVLHALTVANKPGYGRRHKVILVGHSFGGAIAIRAAAKLKQELFRRVRAEVAGVALLATQTAGVPDSLDDLEDVPKLLLHGADDELFPCSLAVQLYRLLSPPKALHILAACQHNFSDHKPALLNHLRTWILERGVLPRGQAPKAEVCPTSQVGEPSKPSWCLEESFP